MTTFGIFLSSEEHPGSTLVKTAVRAEQAGFTHAWLSDHYHPWTDDQGQSPFVWAVLGGIAAATDRLHVTTGVTCPTVRIHPAVVAQAAATTKELFEGRFSLGVGTGEALNEHILGDHWPRPEVRLEMLEEAVEIMRELWTGQTVDHDGEHYVVENARLYTLPSEPVDVLVSGFGPKAIRTAARIGDGFITTKPDKEGLQLYRDAGGKGRSQAGVKVCWAADKDTAVKTAHKYWRNEQVPGQLAQDLATPTHFEMASQLVTEDMMAESVACGPDPDEHVETIQAYVDAGFDEVYVGQMGPDQDGFIDFYTREVLPRLAG